MVCMGLFGEDHSSDSTPGSRGPYNPVMSISMPPVLILFIASTRGCEHVVEYPGNVLFTFMAMTALNHESHSNVGV